MQQQGLKTYPTGYRPAQGATFLGLKAYRNINGVFFHLSQSLLLEGGLFADNQIGIVIDRSDDIRIDGASVTGESDSYHALMVAKRLDKFICNAPHIGMQLHTFLNNPDEKGEVIVNIVFSGFSHIPCSDAVPFTLDNTVR
jgi:hypothetical protein